MTTEKGIVRRISRTWLVTFALVWWTLTLPREGGLGAGLLAVGIATLFHARLGGAPGARGSVLGALRFIPFFVVQSVRGGVNVALAALSPASPLAPVFVCYRTRIPDEHARVFFLNTISLLPGTLSARMRGSDLVIHLLAEDGGAGRRLRALEERVAGAFRIELPRRAPEWRRLARQPPPERAPATDGEGLA